MNMKRMRGRNHRPNNGGGGGGGFRNQQNGIPLNRNHVFDSSGPEMRLRGTAQQLHEKYTQLARDASSSGDRVTGEAYYQHAEHYFRIISAINQAQNPNGQPVQNPQNPQHQAPPQNAGNYQANGQNDYQRRADSYGENGADAAAEPQQAEPRYQETRYQEPRYQEPRGQESRHQESRNQEPRNQEPRNQEPRNQEPRPYEARNEARNEGRNRPDYQRQERYRPDAPVADTRIDISSALEAELAAATVEPNHFGQQPAAPAPAAESRAIPIIPDAPPPATIAAAPKVARPRGRPRLVKPTPEKNTAGD